MKNSSKTALKFIILLVVVGAALFGYFRYDAAMYLTHENIEKIVDASGIFGPLVFAVIYFLVILLFIPASAFSVLAGLLFGTLYGVIIVVIAATAAAQIAFYLSRYYGKSFSEKFSRIKFTKTFVTKMEHEVEESGFQAFFIMRSLFLPYITASYAAGFIRTAKARDFFLATLITNAIFSPAFVFFGDQLFKGPRALILPAALIVIVLLVPYIVKKLRKKALPVSDIS